MNFTYRPLVWTGPCTPDDQRKSRWTFRAGWADTVDRLDYEILHLNGSACVLEADFREQDLRMDGMLRANARQPEFPGVKISFNTPRMGRLEYATDTHELWQHNVRAIALSLEALRAVDRYGTTSGRQQYTGFKAIGSGATPMPGPMSKQDAAQFIATHADPLGGGRQTIVAQLLAGNLNGAYRRAAQRLHPDAAGGSTELFQRLQEARRILEGAGS